MLLHFLLSCIVLKQPSYFPVLPGSVQVNLDIGHWINLREYLVANTEKSSVNSSIFQLQNACLKALSDSLYTATTHPCSAVQSLSRAPRVQAYHISNYEPYRNSTGWHTLSYWTLPLKLFVSTFYTLINQILLTPHLFSIFQNFDNFSMVISLSSSFAHVGLLCFVLVFVFWALFYHLTEL